MSNKPIKMNKLRQIIRLYSQGIGTKRIHEMVSTSRNTIKKYIRIWQTLGIGYEEFNAKSDSDLAIILTTPVARISSAPRMQILQTLLPDYCKR